MRKNFRLMAVVVMITTTIFGAFAQEETHKDVILDGKPAKLNLKTGQVNKVNKNDSATKKAQQDSTKFKTEIQANLITNTTQTKTSKSENVIVTSKPDTLAQHYKNLLIKEAELKSTLASGDSLNLKRSIANDVILISSEDSKPLTTSSEEPATESRAINKTYSGNTDNFHIVQKGETLYALARMYDTTLGELKRANGLETTLIKIGQKLHVRNFENSFSSGVWVVSKGDTLYSIAKKNNTSVKSLKALNGLTSDLIIPGQKLQL